VCATSEQHLVLDASAVVDLVLGQPISEAIAARLDGCVLHAPAHLDVQVLSALGRLHRAGSLTAREVSRQIDLVAVAPIERHRVAALLRGAWGRRSQLRLADALYVELASGLGVPLVTTDAALARATLVAEVAAVRN
jgi:predicted nucleic acid-binding protein